jgi:hypothetical protein
MANFWDDPEALAAISNALGQGAKASASGRAEEGQYLNARDALKVRMFGDQLGAHTAAQRQALENAKFGVGLPGQGAREAVQGSNLANMQDVGIDLGNNHANVVHFTGGSRPSNLTPEARATGHALIAHGSKLASDPNSFMPAASAAPTAPGLSETPTAGFWGQAAGIGSTAAGLAALLKKLTDAKKDDKGGGSSVGGGSGSGGPGSAGRGGGGLPSRHIGSYDTWGMPSDRNSGGMNDFWNSQEPTPNVTTDESFDMSPYVNFTNPDFTGPQDPSGGTGIGPGMQAYYDSLNGGGGGDQSDDPYADDAGGYW